MTSNVKHPCIGCKYFTACGSTSRTMPCEGRVLESVDKKNKKKGK